jgi:GNAT superfamily N-acetyltransferase
MVDVRFVPLAAPPDETVIAVAARIKTQTVGLGLADLGKNKNAKIRSFFVEPDHQRQGVGAGLCAALEEHARSCGAKSLEAMFEASGPYGQAAEKIAEKRGWEPTQPRTLVCRASWAKFKTGSFVGRPLPEGYVLFPWTDLSDSERAAIVEEQARAPFYPPALSPFEGPPYEPLNSLGLRKEGRVVGWMVTHRVGPGLIRYSSLFVREEERGAGLQMLAESVRRAAENGIEGGVFGVNNQNRTMIGVMSKHLRPLLDEYREIAYVGTELANFGGP